ncbi:hypothetical protein [Xanthomonas sp. 3075]|uniref:hypothetical protein n=1 Tax=Xanthomonas sp. 3075 TaxID=3035315 RepID=UPI00160C46DF|nr:hypothetical protein [Xanthomonas sp. 3075]MBB4132903.1 hypothetical protein [Xanthomonas sp. 3075]
MTSPTPVTVGADARWIGATCDLPADILFSHASFCAPSAQADPACTNLVRD